MCEGLSPISSSTRSRLGRTSLRPPQWLTQKNPDRDRHQTTRLHASLISPADTWGNIAALSSTAALAQTVGQKTTVGRLLGPPVTAMAMAFVLSSVGVLPSGGSLGAKILQQLSLFLATPLLLLGADLRACRDRCGPLLGAFLLASIGTVLGCLLAWPLCGMALKSALGGDGLKIAAALLAKNVGGGINYIAVCQSLSAGPNAIAAGLCVDNIFALLYFPATSALGAGRNDLDQENKEPSEGESVNDGNEITLERMSIVLSLAAVITWLGQIIGGAAGAIPLSTLITVIFASMAPIKWLKPLRPAADVFGTCLLYLFFATAGAPGLSVADSVRNSIVPLGIFLSLLYGVHGLVLWAARLISKSPYTEPQRLLVGSSAAIGGPATAAALAQAQQWESLVAPALLVGNLGYAIATFCGLAFYAVFAN